jgi:hypothetical protein
MVLRPRWGELGHAQSRAIGADVSAVKAAFAQLRTGLGVTLEAIVSTDARLPLYFHIVTDPSSHRSAGILWGYLSVAIGSPRIAYDLCRIAGRGA